MMDGYSPTTTMSGQDHDRPPPPPPSPPSPPPPPKHRRRKRRRMITSMVRIVLVLGGCMYILISQLVVSTSQLRSVLFKNVVIEYWQANNVVVDSDINLNIPNANQQQGHHHHQQQQQQHHHHHHQSTTTAVVSSSTSTATTIAAPPPPPPHPPQYQHDDPRERRRDSKNNERLEQNISDHHHHHQLQQQHEDHSNSTGGIISRRNNNNNYTTANTSDLQKSSVDDVSTVVVDDNTKKKKEASSSQTKPQSTPAKLLDSSDADSGSSLASLRISQQEPQSQPQPQHQRHVVFIGDGTIMPRNGFMEWLHRRHHHHQQQHQHPDFAGNSSGLENCPMELIDEKIHRSKQEYVDWSTKYFDSNNGRSEGSGSTSESQLFFNTTLLPNMRDSNNVNVVVESIHYRSSTGNTSWYATYIDLPGGNDIFNSSFISKKDFSSNFWETILTQIISKSTNLHQSQPATIIPTAVVITCPSLVGSEGRRKRVAHPRHIRRMLEGAYDATNKEGIVIWRPSHRIYGGMATSFRPATATTTATMTTTTTTTTTTKDDFFLNDNDDPGAHPSETDIDLEGTCVCVCVCARASACCL